VAVILLSAAAGLNVDIASDTVAPRAVTLDEALAAADTVPEVVIARATERVASAEIGSARAPGEPKLLIATRSVTAREVIAVSIPFRWGGQKSSAVSEAEAHRDAAASSREVAIATARRACRVAWFTLAASEDRLRAATALVSRSERNLSAIADLFELQRASRLDVARATSEAATARATRVDAEQAVIAASAELRALLGFDDVRLTAGETRPTPQPEGPEASWLARSRVGSPDLVLAEAELRAADARVSRSAREKRPSTSLEAGAD